ncbi:hypothetical protein, partial [Streptosporangium sandarakinum]|uniref:hypothetical protein n=1 Tax=Streptosporangium sandarakinum TaxID=1260955 RepID=UPI0033A38BB7
MRRSNGAGSLPAFSMMVAGVLMASAACGSATPVQRDISPAGNAAGDARPAGTAPIAAGSTVTAMTGDTAPAAAGEARRAGAV